MSCSVEVICVGRELLIGKIQNTNAQWLAKRITSLGGEVKRVTVVEDEVEEISTVISEALARKPHLVITTGGLGPTFDDKTLESISKALKIPLKVNDKAYKMVEEKYRHHYGAGVLKKFELSPARVKMAILPEGSKPLQNPVGTAPGVLIKHNDVIIVVLPGVPSEMKAIFDESVAPLVRGYTKNLHMYEKSLKVTHIIESEIAPLIDIVVHDHPYVYIKSHPKGAEPFSLIELHFSTTADKPEVAKDRIKGAVEKLSQMITERGGKVE